MDEIVKLKNELAMKQAEISRLQEIIAQKETQDLLKEPILSTVKECSLRHIDNLDNASISRYSRQLILPEIGVRGQIALKNTRVLIVGAGGLGCPAAVYLAAAGIGRIGLVDYDEAEVSNLHRQILHAESRLGVPKALSAAEACKQLNSSVEYVPYNLVLDSSNALDIIEQYDIILDATDNVATRYLLNDACILAKKPLVSGSALRFEGQLTVYNYNSGPCYRCLYAKPPPPEMVTNCSDGGVLGVVPGIIGSLQALEAIKIAVGNGSVLSQKLLLFDALDTSFKTIKLRARQKGCAVCGETPSITELIDYEQFCGAKATDKDKELSILGLEDRISVEEYKRLADSGDPHLLVDVRLPVEMDICQLPGSFNLPMDRLDKDDAIGQLKERIRDESSEPEALFPVFVVCRRGNDSQLATQKLAKTLADIPVKVKDIRGGLTAWATHVDRTFPTY